MDSSNHVIGFRAPPRFVVRAWLDAFARRFPFVGLVGALIVSNLAGSFFNFFYNTLLIVQPLTKNQAVAFWDVAAPLYNAFAYPLCIGIFFCFIWPLIRCLWKLRRGTAIEPAYLQFCQRRLINLPIAQLIINPLGWLPGMIIFPF